MSTPRMVRCKKVVSWVTRMQQCELTLHAFLQQRALLTYIKRIYFPFLVREPELISVAGHLCAIWLHSLNCSRTASVGTVVLGLAVVIPSLKDLATALNSIEELILQSGRIAKLDFGPLNDLLGRKWPLHSLRI